jgi:hypothetical protein
MRSNPICGKIMERKYEERTKLGVKWATKQLLKREAPD